MSSPKGGLRPFQPCKFARYTLLHPIAKGGMGEVFLAQMTGAEGFEKLIVIKKILADLAQEGDFVQRFVAEAKILVQLHHGAIAQILDMGVEGGSYYIAMEFVDGKDLRKLLSRTRDTKTRVPVGLALHIIVRILDALAYAHRKTLSDGSELNLVHRDISPQNILVSYEGEVKLIDFGLAKSSAAQQQKTRAGMVVGKIFYMAPEQALHEIVDKRSDLYSAGICLWEMLAGKNPFDTGESALMLMHRVSNPEIPSIRTIRPDLPEALDDFLKKAIAPDPDDRFASAEEMRGRLTAVMMEIDPMAGPESLAGYMRQIFTADFENERRNIAALSKAIPAEEAAARAAPRLSATRQIPTASAATAHLAEPLRPFAPVGERSQEKSLSGRRPRRTATHDHSQASNPPIRKAPAGDDGQQRQARARNLGPSLEDPSDTPRPDDTDPAKTPRQLSAPAVDPTSPHRGFSEKRSSPREPKTRLLSREAFALEDDVPDQRIGQRTLPPQERPGLATAQGQGPRSRTRVTGGRKWSRAMLAGLLAAGLLVVIGLFLMKAPDNARAPQRQTAPPPSAATPRPRAAEGTPARQGSLAEPMASPGQLRGAAARVDRQEAPKPAPPSSAAEPPKRRSPDKARAALRRNAIPSSMDELSQIFRSLSAEFTELKEAQGCEHLAMMCEFHEALALQHRHLVENSKKQIPPTTYPRDRRNFWESLKLLEASLSEQQQKLSAPNTARP